MWEKSRFQTLSYRVEVLSRHFQSIEMKNYFTWFMFPILFWIIRFGFYNFVLSNLFIYTLFRIDEIIIFHYKKNARWCSLKDINGFHYDILLWNGLIFMRMYLVLRYLLWLWFEKNYTFSWDWFEKIYVWLKLWLKLRLNKK
jgi:hypothetical protein